MSAGLIERKYWVKTLIRIIDPVLRNGAARRLRTNMPKGDLEKWNKGIQG